MHKVISRILWILSLRKKLRQVLNFLNGVCCFKKYEVVAVSFWHKEAITITTLKPGSSTNTSFALTGCVTLDKLLNFSVPCFLKRCYCSIAKPCPTLCDSVDCSMPGFPVLHSLLEFAPTHVHRVADVIQPSYPLSSPSPNLNLSQHQGLFLRVGSSNQVARVWELQLQ